MILRPNQRHHILSLPVVLISTQSKDGIRNAAPWSCVTPVLRPLEEVLIVSWIKRDTLDNIRETGEFVMNVPPAGMEEAIMISARNFPPEVDEFEMAGLKVRPSAKVKPPGIEGCIAWAECVLTEEIPREKFIIIIGKVVHLEADDRFFNDRGEMDYERAKPLGTMAGDSGMRFVYPVSSGKSAGYASMFKA